MSDKGRPSDSGSTPQQRQHLLEPIAELAGTAPITRKQAEGPALPFQQAARPPRIAHDLLGGRPAPQPVVWSQSDLGAEAIVHLSWHEPTAAPRLRSDAAFRRLLDAMEDEPDAGLDADDPAFTPDRRDVFEVLARGAAVAVSGLASKLMGAVRPDGKLAVPLVLARGRLVLSFDEIERLKSTVAVVTVLSRPELPSHALCRQAREILEVPGLDGAAVGGVTRALRDAIHKEVPSLAAGYVANVVERALLERRAYQTRVVLGGEHIRAQLVDERAPEETVPIYLPMALRQRLPLYRALDARLLIDIYPRQDEQEKHGCAGLLRALAHVVPPPALG